MKLFCRIHVWFLIGMILAQTEGLAATLPVDPAPARNPEFSLLESGEDFVRIRFDRAKSVAASLPVFVGIPAGATTELKCLAWKLDDSDSTSGETTDASAFGDTLLKTAVKTKDLQYQELDILRLTITPQPQMPDSVEEPSSNRVTASILQLDFEVRWIEENESRKPDEISQLDAGYSRLFRNLCINGNDTNRLRRKRSIALEEKSEGFSPEVIDYRTEGNIINPAYSMPSMRRDALRISVRETGMLAVRVDDLLKQGILSDLVNLEEVRMWHRGVEQPVYIKESGDGKFGPDDAIIFYGVASDSEYTFDAPYFMTWFKRDTPPKRISERPIEWIDNGETVVTGRRIYDDDHVLGKNRSELYGWFLLEMDKQEKTVPFDLPGIVPDSNIDISFEIMNRTRRRCDFDVQIGSATATLHALINAASTVVFSCTAGQIIGATDIRITMDKDPQAGMKMSGGMSEKLGNNPFLFIDRIEYAYRRNAGFGGEPYLLQRDCIPTTAAGLILQTTQTEGIVGAWVMTETGEMVRMPAGSLVPAKAIRLPDERWQWIEIQSDDNLPGPHTIDVDYPSTLHRKDQGYNYVIISNAAFMKPARILARRRADEGFKVLLADVQDIYDEFNYSYPDCDAIKRFLRYAQSEWNGLSPEFVVLVGDSNWDHRDRLGFGAKDWIPTYAPVNRPQDDAIEEWYAYLWGGNADYCSDIIIGRISVKNTDEVERYLAKLDVYQNECPAGPWKARNLFVTDDTFERYAVSQIDDHLSPQCFPYMIDQEEFPHESNPYLYHRFQDSDDSDPDIKKLKNRKHSPECTLAILKQLDRGSLIMQYIGHGGAQIWSDERLFYGTDTSTSHLLELKPNTRFPFVISWSCLTGYLNLHLPPFTVCLGEEFLRYADRGAIAMWAPVGSGTPDEHMALAKILMRCIFDDGLTRIGEAVSFTKAEYMQNRFSSSLVDQYTLFGDPSVTLKIPQESLEISVEPGYFMKSQDGNPTTLKTSVSGFDAGQAVVSMTVDGKNIYESEPFAFQNGQIQHEFSVSAPEVENPTASIRIYAWNEEKNLDAWGGTRIPLFVPALVLENGNASKEGSETHLTFDVRNISGFDTKPVVGTLKALDWSESVEIGSVSAGGKITIDWKSALPDTADYVYAEIEADPVQNLESTSPDNRLAIPLRSPEENPVAILMGMASFSKSDLIEGTRVSLKVPFEKRSDEPVLELSASLNGPGSATASKTLKLSGDRNQTRLEFPIDLPQAGEYDYSITAKFGEKEITSAPIHAAVFGKPDLALAEGDFSVRPDRPAVGHTVYLKTTVYNVGEGPAENVMVHAFDGDPELKRKLDPFNHSRQPVIPRIEPGDMKEIEIIWDPERYDGLGSHQINFVVDPLERIDEISEDNNRAVAEVQLYDLPELGVDPWAGHGMKLDVPDTDPIPIWGQPMTLEGHAQNDGDSDADYVRFTFVYNDKEITRFFDKIQKDGVVSETQVDVPLYSAKNTLTVFVDRYDLIGEKNETTELRENASNERRLELQLKMPEEPVTSGRRIYRVTDEIHFSAGKGEFLMFDPKSGNLILHPDLEKIKYRLTPDFVDDNSSYSLFPVTKQWQWNKKFASFYSPDQEESQLRFNLPAPNGTYDVYVHAYSSAYGQGQSAKIKFKSSTDPNFIELEHAQPTEEAVPGIGIFMRKIGTYKILDDRFYLDFMSVPGGQSTSLGDILFLRTDEAKTVSAGYLSPYFSATGSGSGTTTMTWNASVPDGTNLRIKARWVFKNNDGSLRFFPWAKIADGKTGILNIPGRGQYFQYYAEYERDSHGAETPLLNQVVISIPCKE